jgi:hypothetical protein
MGVNRTGMEPTITKISGALYRTLERIASGYQAQLGPQAGGLAFAILASMLCERGLVRVVKRHDGTRPYALTEEGKNCLAGFRLHGSESP